MTRRQLIGFGVVASAFRVLAFEIQNPNPRNPLPRTPNPEPVVLRIGRLDSIRKYAVESIPLESYVAQVVAGEALRGSQPAALEALAIAIRTFALANATRHRGDGFDLCDQTHCQVLRPATPATTRAADATAGRVLLRGNTPAQIFFSASCGGRTEIPSAVWPGAEDPPFLPSRPDDACQGAPAWTTVLVATDLLRALRDAGFTGERLIDVRVASRTGSGRVGKLQVVGLSPGEISGQDLRMAVGRTLGWQHIKSTAFELKRAGNAYRFTGKGSGHGVGMCVIGSGRLAVQGRSAAEILERYFPGLTMGIFSGDLRFTVYRGTNLLRMDALAKTAEEWVAYKYDGGLKGFSTDLMSRVAWHDTGGQPQRNELGGVVNQTIVPEKAQNRVLVAEGRNGSLAAFTPPHTFFFTREKDTNLGYVWWRKDA